MGLLDSLLRQPTVLRQKLPIALPASIQSSIRKIDTGAQKAAGALDILKRAVAGRPDPPQSQPVANGPHWSAALGRTDPQLNTHWDAFLLINGVSFDISAYIEEVQLPSVSFQSTEVFYQGTMMAHAETENYADMTLRLYEDVDQSAMRFMRKWKASVRNSRGDFGLPSEYMGTLVLFSKDAKNVRQAQYKCLRVFPISVSGYTFSSGNGDRHILDVSLSVYRMVLLPVEEDTGPEAGTSTAY